MNFAIRSFEPCVSPLLVNSLPIYYHVCRVHEPTGSIDKEPPTYPAAAVATAALMASMQQPPTKPCHNCRRQRLRCDRSYPHCNKCIAAGKECLGYGQLFRWTGAVASRGKLAGRTSSAPVDAAPASSARKVKARAVVSPTSTPQSDAQSWNGALGGGTPEHGGGQLIRRPSSAGGSSVSSPWVLVDPLFQDLEPSHRYYLSYCK